MNSGISKSFHTLESELEEAKESLKGVDKNIERLTGRSFSKIVPYKGGNGRYGKQGDLKRFRNLEDEEQNEPSAKRYSSGERQRLISKVVVASREVPSRKNALETQHVDEKSKGRNVRMFGALLATLQKFQQEETKFKPKELKRANVEKKIEECEIRRKEEVRVEKQELFHNRRRKEAEIKMLELKMLRMKEFSTWEGTQRPKLHFISTKTKPRLCYLPNILNEASKSLLKNSKADLEGFIEKRKEEMNEELRHIEDRIIGNFKLENKEQKGDNKC